MNFEQFKERFFKFWFRYNPKEISNKELLRSCKLYHETLSAEQIDCPTVDNILTEYEKEHDTLPHNFNIAAYILNWVYYKRCQAAQEQANLDKLPIILPQEGKPIRLVDKPELSEAIEKIRKNSPELPKILEKINAYKLARPYEYCYACDNTGIITFSVFTNPTTGKKYKKYYLTEHKTDHMVAMRCACSKGAHMSQEMAQVTIEECMEIARINQ